MPDSVNNLQLCGIVFNLLLQFFILQKPKSHRKHDKIYFLLKRSQLVSVYQLLTIRIFCLNLVLIDKMLRTPYSVQLILQYAVLYFSCRIMSVTPIRDLPMKELLSLFERQVNRNGVDKFLHLLEESSEEEDDRSRASFSTAPKSFVESENRSVDYQSDSELSEGTDDSGGSEEDVLSNSGQSEDSALDDDDVPHVLHDNNPIRLHDPPVFTSLHCPPFQSIQNTIYGDCDCADFGMDVCCQTNEFQFFPALSLEEEFLTAKENVNDLDRVPCNLLRKRLYKLLFYACDFGILEKNERRKLPNCFVARIRQTYPSLTGLYMGFREY